MGKIICLYGLAACGKTTQADRIHAEFNLYQFGMGDKLREEIASGSTLGQEIKTYVDAGILISDELMGKVISAVGNKIKESGIVFDGFPRIISQAQMLDEISADLGQEVDKFFYLKIKPETALARIAARAELTGRADDKDADAVRNRLGVFEKESSSLIDFYSQKGILVEIDGEMSIDEVYAEIRRHLI